MTHENTTKLYDLLDELLDWDFETFPEFETDYETAQVLKDHLTRWANQRKKQNEYYMAHRDEKIQKMKKRYRENKKQISEQRKISYLKKVMGERIWK